jgi:hypothetical protein
MLIFGDDLIILYEYEKYIKNRFKKIYIGTLLVINSNKMSKKSSEIISTNICIQNSSQLSFFKEKCDTVYGNSNKNMKKSSKSSENNIYRCDVCNYTTSRDSQRKRHEVTRKHKLLITKKTNEHECELNINNQNTCECGKRFAFASGLCLHKKTCIFLKNKSAEDYTSEIIMKLLKDNEEMKKIIIEQNKQQTQIMMQQQQQQQQQQEQQQQIIEMLPKICIGNITNNNNTTNIKQKFNLNFFLNEQCKDAISLCDFVKSLNITFDDLSVTREKNLEESVGSIFMRGLKDLDVFKRPIHCTDTKRDIMYIKDEDIWKKDEGNEKIKSSINEISRKHVKVLKELKDSDPEIKTNELKRDDFILTMNHVCTPIPDCGEKRIIKTISKEVTVTTV